MTNTNIGAPTPESVRATSQAIAFASVLDDRVAQPDKARIAAWAVQLQRHSFTENDLLDGVQAFYDRPSDRAIQVGDLVHHARIVKRDRLDREHDAARDSRRAAHDGKAATDEVPALAASFTPGTAKPTARLTAAETALQCATTKSEAQAAIKEFLAAKAEAKGGNETSHRAASKPHQGALQGAAR